MNIEKINLLKNSIELNIFLILKHDIKLICEKNKNETIFFISFIELKNLNNLNELEKLNKYYSKLLNNILFN